jgi:hypothetical protein
VAVARDINDDFLCRERELDRNVTVGVGRVKGPLQQVPLVQSMPLSGDEAGGRTQRSKTSTGRATTWGRCPILSYQCEPSGSVAAGQAVAIWDRKRKFLCITHPDGAGWIEASAVQELRPTTTEPSDWAGAFERRDLGEVAIAPAAGGTVLVSGALMWGGGEGPGISVYTRREIPLTAVRPLRGFVDVPYTRDVEASVRPGGEPSWSSGEPAPDGCNLQLRLQGPLLVITDPPRCRGEKASGFQGIWFAYDAENPEPRANHARTMPLGR